VVVLTSAHVYARAKAALAIDVRDPTRSQGKPEAIDETHAIGPEGEYGRSKLQVESLARDRARDLDVVIARSFNQIGPGQPRGLFVPDLLAAFARETGPIRMRGTDGVRDFTD